MLENTIIKELKSFKLEEILDVTKSKELIIFDMDGTIFNSEKLHHTAVNDILDSYTYTEEQLYGLADEDLYKLTSTHFTGTYESFVAKKNKSILSMLKDFDKNSLMFSDYPKLLTELTNQKKKLALVTASEYEVAHAMLKHCEIHHYFLEIITTREVTKTKPHPEPYLLALSKLNAQNKDAIIFEDSQTGLQSAFAAKIETVKVNWYENI